MPFFKSFILWVIFSCINISFGCLEVATMTCQAFERIYLVFWDFIGRKEVLIQKLNYLRISCNIQMKRHFFFSKYPFPAETVRQDKMLCIPVSTPLLGHSSVLSPVSFLLCLNHYVVTPPFLHHACPVMRCTGHWVVLQTQSLKYFMFFFLMF